MRFFDVFTTREFGQGVARAGEQLGAGLSEVNRLEREKKRRELEEKLLELKVETEQEEKEKRARKLREEQETTEQITAFAKKEKELREVEPVIEDIREDIGLIERGAAGPTRFGAPEFIDILGPDLGIKTPEEKLAPLEDQINKTRTERFAESPLVTKLNDTRVQIFKNLQIALDEQASPELKALKERGEISGLEGEIGTAQAIEDLRGLSESDKKSIIKNKTLLAGFDADPIGTIAQQAKMSEREALLWIRLSMKPDKKNKLKVGMKRLKKVFGVAFILKEASTGKGRISGPAAKIRAALGADAAGQLLEGMKVLQAAALQQVIGGQGSRLSDFDVQSILPATIGLNTTMLEARLLVATVNGLSDENVSLEQLEIMMLKVLDPKSRKLNDLEEKEKNNLINKAKGIK